MKLPASAPRFEPPAIELTFTKEFRQQLGTRLAQELNRPELSAEQLTPARVSFSYAGSELTGMMHAHLYLHFYGAWINEENADEFYNELNQKASAGVVEVFAQHLNGLFDQQRQAAEERMQQERDLLEREQERLELTIRDLAGQEGSELESGSGPLQGQIRELTKRLRDDEIRLIELQAQRAAIEKRIDQLRAQAAEQQEEDPLLAALRTEVVRLEQELARMRAEMNDRSPVEAAKQIVAAQEKLVSRAVALHEAASISEGELEQARAKLAEGQLRFAETMAEIRSREATLEEKLAQAKIAFLQHQRASSTGRLATQINKLSDMLDELAIEMDTIYGRNGGIEKALGQLRKEVERAVATEMNRKQLDSKINMLELRKAQIVERLLTLEGDALQPSPERIEILPVIP
jgi:hypothetical protein